MNRNRNNQPIELTSDMTELALLAIASPDFIERYVGELFGGAPSNVEAPVQPDAGNTRIAAVG